MNKKISREQMKEMSRVTDEKVEKAVCGLINTYNPIYIYAFGSYARGVHDEDSDFDVMVVIDEYDDKPWMVTSRGYAGLNDIFMPIDLLVYDRLNFDAKKNDPTSFCHTIIKKGKLLYEREKP